MSTFRLNVILSLVLGVAFVGFQVVQAQSDIYEPKDGTNNKACDNALQLLCKSVYNWMFEKRNLESALDDNSYPDNYPLRSKATAMLFGGPRFRRQTRELYDECCVKSCSMDKIISYCGSSI